MAMTRMMSKRLANKELDSWEWAEDCTCEDDPDGTCWYHLSAHQQRECRVERLARLLEVNAL